MPAETSFWPLPASADGSALYLWARSIAALLKAAKYREIATGSFTLTNGATSKTVADTNVLTGSFVWFTPTSATARVLPLHLSAKSQGVSFTVTHAAAAGTETYDYCIFK